MIDYLEEFKKVETCQDWYDFLNNPNYDSTDFGYAISKWTNDQAAYTYLGNIGGDWVYETPTTPAKPNSCMLASEVAKIEQFDYWKMYDKYPCDDICNKIIEFLRFEHYTANVNYQRPNNITRLHFDIMSTYLEEHDDLSAVPFDRETLQPVGMPPLRRVFVALRDWDDGHIFQMGTQQWAGWKKGDVIDFNWRGVPHSTANAGFTDRAFLKVSGFSDIEYFGNHEL